MHAIRNQLNGMIGLLGVLLLQSSDPAAQRLIDELPAGMLLPAQANRINRLVPGHFVPALLDLYRPYAAEHGVRLRHVIDADTPTLPIDTNALHRLLSNLLVNAIKHAQAPRVTVSAQALADWVGMQLIVADEGVGIPAEALSSLQAVLAGRRHPGVEYDRSGLAICAGLAAELGATLSLHSTRGKGTSVTVDLAPAPAVQAEIG